MEIAKIIKETEKVISIMKADGYSMDEQIAVANAVAGVLVAVKTQDQIAAIWEQHQKENPTKKSGLSKLLDGMH
jgi:hypothetical protein